MAQLSPCCDGAPGKKAKLSEAWLLSVVPPRPQKALTGSLVAPAAQEPWRQHHLGMAPVNRLIRGGKEIGLIKTAGPVHQQHEWPQILASLPLIPEERTCLEEATSRPGGMSPVVQQDSEEHMCLERDNPGLNHRTAGNCCLSLRNSVNILSLSLLTYVNWSEIVLLH